MFQQREELNNSKGSKMTYLHKKGDSVVSVTSPHQQPTKMQAYQKAQTHKYENSLFSPSDHFMKNATMSWDRQDPSINQDKAYYMHGPNSGKK